VPASPFFSFTKVKVNTKLNGNDFLKGDLSYQSVKEGFILKLKWVLGYPINIIFG
jgi:hypothetical protein